MSLAEESRRGVLMSDAGRVVNGSEDYHPSSNHMSTPKRPNPASKPYPSNLSSSLSHPSVPRRRVKRTNEKKPNEVSIGYQSLEVLLMQEGHPRELSRHLTPEARKLRDKVKEQWQAEEERQQVEEACEGVQRDGLEGDLEVEREQGEGKDGRTADDNRDGSPRPSKTTSNPTDVSSQIPETVEGNGWFSSMRSLGRRPSRNALIRAKSDSPSSAPPPLPPHRSQSAFEVLSSISRSAPFLSPSRTIRPSTPALPSTIDHSLPSPPPLPFSSITTPSVTAPASRLTGDDEASAEISFDSTASVFGSSYASSSDQYSSNCSTDDSSTILASPPDQTIPTFSRNDSTFSSSSHITTTSSSSTSSPPPAIRSYSSRSPILKNFPPSPERRRRGPVDAQFRRSHTDPPPTTCDSPHASRLPGGSASPRIGSGEGGRFPSPDREAARGGEEDESQATRALRTISSQATLRGGKKATIKTKRSLIWNESSSTSSSSTKTLRHASSTPLLASAKTSAAPPPPVPALPLAVSWLASISQSFAASTISNAPSSSAHLTTRASASRSSLAQNPSSRPLRTRPSIPSFLHHDHSSSSAFSHMDSSTPTSPNFFNDQIGILLPFHNLPPTPLVPQATLQSILTSSELSAAQSNLPPLPSSSSSSSFGAGGDPPFSNLDEYDPSSSAADSSVDSIDPADLSLARSHAPSQPRSRKTSGPVPIPILAPQTVFINPNPSASISPSSSPPPYPSPIDLPDLSSAPSSSGPPLRAKASIKSLRRALAKNPLPPPPVPPLPSHLTLPLSPSHTPSSHPTTPPLPLPPSLRGPPPIILSSPTTLELGLQGRLLSLEGEEWEGRTPPVSVSGLASFFTAGAGLGIGGAGLGGGMKRLGPRKKKSFGGSGRR